MEKSVTSALGDQEVQIPERGKCSLITLAGRHMLVDPAPSRLRNTIQDLDRNRSPLA